MNEAIQKVGFGAIDDTDESLKGKSGGGVFGLNTGYITKLEFTDKAGKDNGPGDAVDIWFMVGEREYRRRIYDFTKAFDKDNNEITDQDSAEYIAEYNKAVPHIQAVIVHAVKATGVTQDMINNAVATGVSDFASWSQKILALVPSDYAQRPVDGFLEYQWKIAADQTKTYVELPKNMKGGYFFTPSVKPVGGAWTPEHTWVEKDKNDQEITVEGLRYVDQNGNVHPFVRNANFMESPKANEQVEGQENAAAQALNNNAPQSAKKSTW